MNIFKIYTISTLSILIYELILYCINIIKEKKQMRDETDKKIQQAIKKLENYDEANPPY